MQRARPNTPTPQGLKAAAREAEQAELRSIHEYNRKRQAREDEQAAQKSAKQQKDDR